MNDSDFDGVIDGGIAIGLGVYLAVVFWRGNINALFQQVKTEGGFIEFLIAAFIIYKLLQIKMTRPIIGLLVLGAFIVAAQNVVSKADMTAFTKFGQGSINLFELASALFA